MAAQSGAAFEDLSARAKAAREANDVPHAIELYKDAVKADSKWEEGWWYLGSLLYDTDQYSGGRDALMHVVQLDSGAVPAWALLGLCEFELGDYAVSLEHIQRALNSKTTAPQIENVLRYHEALLLTRTGAFDKALKAYVWFARKGVRNPELLSAIGLAALRTPLLPKEVKADQELYSTAGEAAYFTMAGDYTEAGEAFSRLLQRFPRAHYVHYLYGSFLLAAKPDVALQELRRELEITPLSGPTNAILAWVLLERGQTAAALPYARSAVEHDPALPLAQYSFGRCLLEKGDLNGSIEHLQLAEKGDPDNLETHMSLTTAYSRAGQLLEARRERKQTLELWNEVGASASP